MWLIVKQTWISRRSRFQSLVTTQRHADFPTLYLGHAFVTVSTLQHAYIYACVMSVCYSVSLVKLILCFLHRRCSQTAPQDLSLLTSRKSHDHMIDVIWPACHSDERSPLAFASFSQGREPIRHSPATSDSHQRPLRAGGLIAAQFSHNFQCHLPLLCCGVCWSGTRQNLASARDDKEKMPFESGIPLLLQTLTLKCFGIFIFQYRCSQIYYIYIFYCVPMFKEVILGGPHFYLHLRNGWMKTVVANTARYLCCWCCLFIVKMTVGNRFLLP